MAKNGTATGANPVFEQDKLDRARVRQLIGERAAADPTLQKMINHAIGNGYTDERFKDEFFDSDYYKAVGAYEFEATLKEARGGQDWLDLLANRRSLAANQIAAMGVNAGDDAVAPLLDELARRWVYEGWDEQSRSGVMRQAIADALAGAGVQTSIAATAKLRDLASANGVKLNDSWFSSAERSMASGLSTVQTWQQYITDTAAGAFPGMSEKIRAGMTVKDLSAPWRTAMADELELDADSISLDDTYIRDALSQMTDKGDPYAMSLTDFRRKVRQDPRWQYTKNAWDKGGEIVSTIMDMFGYGG